MAEAAIAPPPGFELDEDFPAPPEGFELDSAEPLTSKREPLPLLDDEAARRVPDMQATTRGGPQLRTPGPEASALLRKQVGQALTEPIVPIPKFTINPDDHPLTAIGKEAVNLLAGIPEFIESPLGIAALPAAALAPATTAAAFTTDMVHSLGKQIDSTYKDWSKMTPAQKAVAVTDMAGTGLLAGLTGHATIKGAGRFAESKTPRGAGIGPERIPAPPKGFELDETPQPTEVANAGSQPISESVLEREKGPPVGEETPLRQQGEAPTTQAANKAAEATESGLPLTEAKAPEVTPEVSRFIEAWNDPAGKVSNASNDPAAVTTTATGLKTKSVGDLDALLSINNEARGFLREIQRKKDAGETLTPEETARYFSTGMRIQFPREVVEFATNSGSWADAVLRPGETRVPRPLDWKTHPEIADWLKKNAEDLGIALPEELKAKASAPNAQPEAPRAAAGDLLTPVSEGTMPAAKPVEAKPADIISQLESLKIKPNDAALLQGGEALSSGLNLPHPEQIKAIGATSWNAAIDIAIAGVKAGKALKVALDDALAHIRKNAVGKFDETQARANLESIFPKTDTSGENVKMRKLSERGTVSETIPEPVQEQISASPESYYRQQSLSGVEGRVQGMTESELAAVPKESDIYTAAKLEQATRLFNEGKSEQGYRVFQDLSAELTRLGQVINQAKLLQAFRPEHVVTVVNKELVRAGRDPLTPEQANRVKNAAQGRIDAQADLNKTTKEWQKNPTDANAAKAEKALDEVNKAAVEEQKLVNQFKPRTTAALIKAILQGNLLTPISQVANLVGNVNFMPFRTATRAGATAIDMLDSAIRNRPRQVSESLAGTKASVQGLVKGLKKVPGILARGTGDVIKGETRAGLHPLRAWVKQFAKNPDVPTIGGKIPFSDRVNLAIEGTFGVPAEIMLRGLGAGDIGFSEMARGRLISEQARLKNLSPKSAKLAQKFPELFFDKQTLDLINNETRGAVFQRSSKTLDHLLSWIKGRGDLFDLAVSFVAPYKLTPWNIVGEILSYNPLIATGRAALEAKRGNIRGAEMNASKAVVGSMLVYAGYWLYEKGLMAPSMDSRDEQQKARVLAGEVLPPNHINVSGLNRALKGGDPAFNAGDETVDVFRGGGLAGSMFYMMANIGRDAETKPEADNAILSVLKNSTIEQARFGLNQSFLKGVTGLLDAVREGEADNYVQSVANTVLSIPLPNTLSAISRAERQYKVDTSDASLKKQVENTVRTRLGFAGMDDYLPLKRGLWGEPMPETPQDRNALVYHFFDISKNLQVTSDPVPLELYRLWRKTANTSVIPTPPEKTLTSAGQTFLLKPEQRSRLSELVGTQRREMVDKVVVNPEWYKIPDEQKIKMLDWIYDGGLEIGKAKFLAENPLDQLQKKPMKAGFK